MHTPPTRLRLQPIDNHAIVTEARGEERAAESAAAIERDCVRAFNQAAVAAIETAHHASVSFVGLEQFEKSSATPPERIALQVERFGRIQPGVNE